MKAMEEIHKLRAQISNIVQTNFPGVEAGFEPPRQHSAQITAVRADRVEQSSYGNQHYVYIRPSSVLANGPPPEFVVFSEVVRTSQVWLKAEQCFHSYIADS
ncbi:hypothetical protein C8J56DRAFT_1162003 [Mycena floridula]|nr:hypothetical protein C8J56DRAFT_1162003 [Mycena floridula]